MVGAHAASVTERLGFLLAHRPGFVAPPVAARKLATLDQLSNGRLAVHIITGGSDADQAKDGDWTDHAARYRRTSEYVSLLRRTWTEPAPFDHDGEFYRTRGTYSQIRCLTQPCIPVYGGGGSDAAIAALAPQVDVFMLWGEPLEGHCAVHGAGAAHGGSGGPPPDLQPLDSANPRRDRRSGVGPRARSSIRCWRNRGATGRRRGRISGQSGHCRRPPRRRSTTTCLWTSLAAATRPPAIPTALVGSLETVAKRVARILQTRRHQPADPRLRPLARHGRVRRGTASTRPRPGRRIRRRQPRRLAPHHRARRAFKAAVSVPSSR